MIVVEGPDGSGKTTLIKRVLALYPAIEYVRFGGPPEDDAEGQRRLDWMLSFDPDKPTILDRCPAISERVYGKSIRKSVRPSDEACYKTLLKFIAKHDPLFIFTMPPHRYEAVAMSEERKEWKPDDFKKSVRQVYYRIVRAYEEEHRLVSRLVAPRLSMNRTRIDVYDMQNARPWNTLMTIIRYIGEKFPWLWHSIGVFLQNGEINAKE